MMTTKSRRGLKRKNRAAFAIFIDKQIVDNEKTMYLVDVNVTRKKDEEPITHKTVHCNLQHDLGIDWILSSVELKNKSFEKLEIKVIKKIGNSSATKKEITKWTKYEII
jgi:hypothetical protein